MRRDLQIRPLLKWWLISYLCWGVLSLAFGWQIAQMISLPWAEIFRIVGPGWFCWGLVTPLVFRFVGRLPIERSHWKVALPVHIAAGLATALMIVWMSHVFGPERFRPPHKSLLGALLFSPHLPIYIILLSAAHASYFYRRAQERERRAFELTASLAQARLQALQMQIQPHFLFNSLNALAALIRRDADAADEMLAAICDFLRLTLESSGEQEVPLQRELQFAECYLAIEKVRFGERLHYEIDAPKEILAAMVPALVLQPLVENAVRHGIEPRRIHGCVKIVIRRENDQLTLKVTDNGPGLRQPAREGIGLANTRGRLHELYGSTAALKLSEDNGVTVAVTLPFRRSA